MPTATEKRLERKKLIDKYTGHTCDGSLSGNREIPCSRCGQVKAKNAQSPSTDRDETLSALDAEHNDITTDILLAAQRVPKLLAERDALVVALRSFGSHADDCNYWMKFHEDSGYVCTCGYDAALALVSKE